MTTLIEQRDELRKKARDLHTALKGDPTRSLSAEETVEAKGWLDQADALDVQIRAAADTKGILDRLGSVPADATSPAAKGEDAPARSLGELFVKKATAFGLKMLRTEANTTVGTDEFTAFGAKANTDVQTTPGVFDDRLTVQDTTIVRGFRRTSIADLFGVGALGANSTAVSYFVEGGVEGSFATVAPLGQKPQLHFADPVKVIDSVTKIAAWFDVADEMIEDADFWVTEINNRGLYLLSLAEESQLLAGDGSGANLRGVLNRSGIQAITQPATDEPVADTIFRALTAIQTGTGIAADGIVVNPLDYQALRLSKDDNGNYQAGGPFSGAGLVQPLWGLPTVVTTAVAKGTILVGAFKAATTVYRKGGVRVETTNSDRDKFTRNIVTTRIEERLALAVRIPAAIAEVTLAA